MTARPSIAALARAELERARPDVVRAAIRAGRWTGNTKRLALGFHQANVTILPAAFAFDFMRFCQRNPRALPLLDVTDPGDPAPPIAAPDADIRIDIPAYCIYRDGKMVERVRDLRAHWRPDHVAFLTGCNLSLDSVLLDTGIPFPHLVREDAFPAQYRSSIACRAAGVFQGPLVVTYRPVPQDLLLRVIELTSRFPVVARRAGPRRRPGPHRHPRPQSRGLGPAAGGRGRHDSGVLALRHHGAGGRDGDEDTGNDHPRAGPHVRHGSPGRRPDARLSEDRQAGRAMKRTTLSIVAAVVACRRGRRPRRPTRGRRASSA